MFFFYFKNVFMCGKNEDKEEMNFFSVLVEEDFQFYFNSFIKDGTVYADGKVFETVKIPLFGWRRRAKIAAEDHTKGHRCHSWGYWSLAVSEIPRLALKTSRFQR